MSRKNLFVMMTVLVLIGLALIAGTVTAQTPSVTGSTWPYTGQLNDLAGQPVADGAYDFVFTLYAGEKDELALWSEMQTGVYVKNGEVTTSLGAVVSLPATLSDKASYWLAVSVRGPNDKGFTLLTPRRAFSATSGVIEAVKALTCPHNHFSDYWNGVSGSYGVEVDNYGIGDAIRAYSASTAKNYAAVYAVNVATTGVGTAVYGSSDHGNGVYAYSGTGDGLEATTSSTSMSAIYAHSINGNGVWAVSTNRIGVHGYSTAVEGVGGESTNSYGVRGYNNHDTATAGNYGGYFTAANYRGGFLATLITTSWYGALIDGGIMVTNGGCTGCTLMYVGMNQGTEALRPGDLLAVAGVEVDAVTGQPVMQVRLATSASDPLIGVVVSGASKPGGQGPDKIQSEKILSGEYVLIAAGGLVQARVADLNVAIGGYLQAGPAGGVATANMERSGVRVMSEPDANGLVWVMISGN